MNKSIVVGNYNKHYIDDNLNDCFEIVCNHCDDDNCCCDCLWSVIATASKIAIDELKESEDINKHVKK